jgi:hypothetical protein
LFTGFVYTGNKFIASAVVTEDHCSLVSLIPAKNYHRCHCHQRSFFSGVNDAGDKFMAGQRKSVARLIAGVNDTADKFVSGVVDTAEQFAIISANFRKKLK